MALLLAFLLQVPADAKTLIEQFDSPDIAKRDAAATAIRKMGKAALPELEKAAKDPDPEVAERARFLAYAATIPLSIQRVMSDARYALAEMSECNYRATSVSVALGRPNDVDQDAFEWLVQVVLESPDPDLQLYFCEFTPRLRTDLEYRGLVRFFAGGAVVCGYALQALGCMKCKEAVPDIFRLLTHTEVSVRMEAAQALGKIGDESAVARLIPLLTDPEPGVRWEAARGLGELKSRIAAGVLVDLLEDSRYFVRMQAVRSLGKLNARDMAPYIARRLTDPDEEVRKIAAIILDRW